MYLLYLDESGTHDSKYFTLCGVVVFEKRTYWLSSAIDQIQKKYLPEIEEAVEFHVSSIRAGKGKPWEDIDKDTRFHIIEDVYDIIRQDQLILFSSAVEKSWLDDQKDAYTWAFEGIVNRFDRFLRDKYKDEGQPQRGIIIIAESQYKNKLEQFSKKIRQFGTVWGEAYNLAEIPLFTSASNSRLLQVADFCVNAIFGRYESGYSKQFDKIAHQFYENDGLLRGLSHYTRDTRCMCPSCISRRNSGDRGLSREDNYSPQRRFPED
ncbi:MAG: DUF3800 domain-containing protein [Dehalococcoidales bacterium]|nr:DUF3800 domain-containing protein [Dehalococcoidales bacterium]